MEKNLDMMNSQDSNQFPQSLGSSLNQGSTVVLSKVEASIGRHCQEAEKVSTLELVAYWNDSHTGERAEPLAEKSTLFPSKVLMVANRSVCLWGPQCNYRNCVRVQMGFCQGGPK